VAAQLPAESAERLAEALQAGPADALRLTWAIGRSDEAHHRLLVEGGRASLLACSDPAACQPLGTAVALSAGQRAQLMSVLRAADLPHLRSADPDSLAAADRALEVTLESPGASPGEPPRQPAHGRWQLPRSEWPLPPPPDGYGVAEFLDELARTVRKAAQVRPPVPVPTTVSELQAVRLQLRLTPRTRPGGLVTIENGLVHVTPAEGSLPRLPLPRPFERPLAPGEQEALLQVLQAAQLDKLDEVVPKRATPAIGDDDGRLAALHLIPQGKQPLRLEPRGIERYLSDLMRSPARPLCEKLVELLLTPPAASARPARSARQPPAARSN
jgi:hypothetical protein